MAITANSLVWEAGGLAPGTNGQVFCQVAQAGQSFCMEKCSLRHEITAGKMHQPMGLGAREGRCHKCIEKGPT